MEKEEEKKKLRSKQQKKHKLLSCGHNMTMVAMSSSQLPVFAQNLCKTEAVNIQAEMEEKLMGY